MQNPNKFSIIIIFGFVSLGLALALTSHGCNCQHLQEPTEIRGEYLPEGTADDREPGLPEGTADDREPGLPEDAADDREPSLPEDAADDRDFVPEDKGGEITPTRPIDLGSGVAVTPNNPLPGTEIEIIYRGTLKDQANLSIHYGFNGWVEISGLAQKQDPEYHGKVDFYQRKVMDRLPPNEGLGFHTKIMLPNQARALHFVFFTEINADEKWDNNKAKDYNLGIEFPYIGPYLTWQGGMNPDNGVVVAFGSGEWCKAHLEYGISQNLGDQQGLPTAGYLHHFVLSGLQANTTYHYRVSCEGGRKSQIYSFKTAPASPSEFKFVVLSDAQDHGQNRWRDVANEIAAKHRDAAFLLFAGDLAWNDKPGLWWIFFDKARPLFRSIVNMPVPGNHDTPDVNSHPDTSSFETYFKLPAKSGATTHYAFRYGSAMFLGLNSERHRDSSSDYEFEKDKGKQYLWLKQTLAQLPSPKPTWIFAYWHIPPYNAGSRHWGTQGRFREITELCDGVVDWVFNGHEHLYQRFKPLRYNAKLVSNYGNKADQGVGYLILPPAGAYPNANLIDYTNEKAYYRQRLAYPIPTKDSNAVPSEVGFVTVEIKNRNISLKTYFLGDINNPKDAHIVDQLSYSK
jgi:hypothetical protein